jgi:RNA polymerase sigma-70 factor (ECF subfamily)
MREISGSAPPAMRVLGGSAPGDLDAFEGLVRQHHVELYRGAYRLTGNHEDAQDLLQDALLEAFAAFAKFRIGTQFNRWVMRIMTHTFIDRTRRRPPFVMQSLDAPIATAAGEMVAQELPDPALDPESEIVRDLLEEPLQNALASLSAEFRLAVVLCDVQGLSYEEAARAVRCPVGTIRSRLHRGREMMRRELGPSLRAVYGRGDRDEL